MTNKITVKIGYKQTEIGVIPEDWEVKKLGEVCAMKSGEGITSQSINEHSEYPCYGGNGLRGFTKRFTHDGRYALIGRQGALCGNVSNVEGKFFASEHAVVVTPFAQTDVQWLTPVLREMKLNQYSESSAQPGLSISKVLQLRLSIPSSKQEQTAIAAALSDVDALMGELDKLIAKKRDIKQATMQQLLTGKKRLAGFSGEWEVKRLGELATLSKIGLNPANTPDATFVHFSLPAFDDCATPVIENGSSIASNKFVVPQNSVLVSKLNPRIPRIWKPLTIPDNSICSTEFLVLLPSELLIDRDFFTVICSSKSVCAQMELHAIGTTGSHQRIQPQQFLKIKVKIPLEQKEQTAIATILSDMDAEINALQQKREKTAQLKQGMMQELLTGRIRLIGGNS